MCGSLCRHFRQMVSRSRGTRGFSRAGETGSSAYLLPLTVDGLVVVASISLVELNARIRAHSDRRQATSETDVVVAQTETSPNGRREPIGMVGTVIR